MLKELQKALGITPKAEGSASAVETLEVKLNADEVAAAVEAAVAPLRAELDEFKQTAEAMVAQAEEQVASLTEQLAAANTLIATMREAAEAAEAAKADAEAAAAAAKLVARKEKLVASIGTERADALLKATEGMDDAAFEAVASALGTSAATEAASPLFKEVGVEAQADGPKVVETAEMRILREKYAKK